MFRRGVDPMIFHRVAPKQLSTGQTFLTVLEFILNFFSSFKGYGMCQKLNSAKQFPLKAPKITQNGLLAIRVLIGFAWVI